MKKTDKDNTITRKEALTKMGKYAALTAAGTFLVLSPLRAQSSSPGNPGDGNNDDTDLGPFG